MNENVFFCPMQLPEVFQEHVKPKLLLVNCTEFTAWKVIIKLTYFKYLVVYNIAY